jgi:hypothetical protein
MLSFKPGRSYRLSKVERLLDNKLDGLCPDGTEAAAKPIAKFRIAVGKNPAG